MNRNEEYTALVEELNLAPLKLDFTLERARARKKACTRRRKRAVFAPLGSLAALLAAFVLLVNVSPTFAYAAGRVPVLRELALAVAFSPSLSAAVENEYVQPVGLEQTKDEITARVEYVIVDQKQLNVFYSLNSRAYKELIAIPGIKAAEGAVPLNGFSVIHANMGNEGDALRKVVVDFSQGSMPEALNFTLLVREPVPTESYTPPAPGAEHDYLFKTYPEPETLAEFSFPLLFDPAYTVTGKTLTLNQDFVIDGQRLILDSVEIYPTTMRLNISVDPANTAWPTSLSFEVENEHGEKFGSSSSGLAGYGFPLSTYVLESPYFSDSKHLTLRISGVSWLDKGKERVHFDLVNKTADFLPENVTFTDAQKREDGWLLFFTAEAFKDGKAHQLWSWGAYSATEGSYDISGMSGSILGPTGTDSEQRFEAILTLRDYPHDEVWLCPYYTRRTELETPVNIAIK